MKRIISIIALVAMLIGCFAVGATADTATETVKLLGYQTSAVYANEKNEPVSDIRIVALGNDEDATAVGFTVTAESYAKSWDKKTTTVFRSLSATDSKGNLYTAVTAADEGYAYVYALVIKGVPAVKNVTMKITPYSIDSSNEKQDGTTASVKVASATKTALTFGTDGNFWAWDEAGKGTVGTDSNTALYQTTKQDGMNWWLHGGFTNAANAGMTANHKYARIVYKLTGASDGATFRFVAGDGGSKFSGAIAAADTMTLSGVMTLSDAAATRLSSAGNWAGFFGVADVPADGVTFELQAICFFETIGEANAFTWGTVVTDPVMLSFGDKGNAGYYAASDEITGIYAYDETKGAVKVGYSTKYFTSGAGGCYMFQPEFTAGVGALTDAHKYVRVYLSVKNPDGIESVSYAIINNANGSKVVNISGLTDTDGFALTSVAVADASLISRLKIQYHCANAIYADKDGGEYYVRGIFFFDNALDAQFFTEADAEKLLNARGGDVAGLPMVTMTFGTNGNFKAMDAYSAGVDGANSTTVPYRATVTWNNLTHYVRGGFKSPSTAGMTAKHKYIRVVYKLTGAAEGGTFSIVNSAYGNRVDTAIAAADVMTLSGTITLSDNVADRLTTTTDYACHFGISGVPQDATFELQAIYFFGTKAEADAFVFPTA